MSTYANNHDRSPGKRGWLATVLRAMVLVAVLSAVGVRVWQERSKLAGAELAVEPLPLIGAGLLYAAGLAPCAVFWRSAMRDGGARPGWTGTLAAYYAGHLAKYVPGKGLVVVVRAGMVCGPAVKAAAAAATSVHETLLMMATGSAVAAGVLTFAAVPHRELLLTSALAAGGLLAILSIPAVIGLLGRMVALPFANVRAGELRGCRLRTVLAGAAGIAVGWLLMGLSLAAVLAAMGVPDSITGRPALLTAAVALATVGGFVSMLPGGLASREWILAEILGPQLGMDRALIAAVLLRIVWIGAEAAATASFYCLARLQRS